MNRWGTYQHSSTSLQNPALMHEQQLLARQEALQHASVGNFIGSSIDGSSSGSGSGSGFIRCVYTAKNLANTSVTLLCDTKAGCCEKGCCPQDLFWMTGVFVLLAFVLFVFILGSCVVICCYWRTKSEQRKEVYEYSLYGSQIGMYPDGRNSYLTQTMMTPRY